MKKTQTKPKPPSLISTRRPALSAALAVVGLAVLVGIYTLYQSFAATATLSLAPATQTVTMGNNFTVTINVNSSTDTINAVQADLTFPKDKLQFVSIDSSTSAFSIQAANSGSNTLGTVTIARGVTGGSTVSGPQQVAKVTFKAIATGSAPIAFAASSAVVRSTDNVNILATKTGGTYTVADSIAPTAPTGLTSPSQTVNSINLSWAAATDNVAVTGYRIYRNGTQVATSVATSYTNTGLTPNTNYTYTVAAVDAAGNVSPQSVAITPKTLADTSPPTAPGALNASTRTMTSVSLTWSQSTDNVAVTQYRILRNGTQVGTTSVTSYTDNGLSPATAYNYTVRAADAAGNVSPVSNAVSVTTMADTAAPTAPTGLKTTTVSGTSVALSWTASTDNVGVTGYKIFRNGTQVATSATTSYTNTGLTYGTTYSYTVAAYDAAGNTSAQTAALSVTTRKTGDIDGNGAVNIFDLSILLTNFGRTTSQATNAAADINNDGKIDIFDLSTLLNNYGI